MDFFENVMKVSVAQGITPTDICNALNINKSAFTHWRNGMLPRAEVCVKLAQYLGVSVDYLLTGDKISNELSPQEKKLIDDFHVLDEQDKKLVTLLLNELVKRY